MSAENESSGFTQRGTKPGFWSGVQRVTIGAKRSDIGMAQGSSAGNIADAMGGAGLVNPYLMAAGIAIKQWEAIQANKAALEEARNKANHLRRQGQAVMRKAWKQGEDVKDEERFKTVEEAAQVRKGGFTAGSESLSGGTGVSSVFAANKKAAEALSNDILDEGRKQKREYDRAADETERAARERIRSTFMGRVTDELGVYD